MRSSAHRKRNVNQIDLALPCGLDQLIDVADPVSHSLGNVRRPARRPVIVESDQVQPQRRSLLNVLGQLEGQLVDSDNGVLAGVDSVQAQTPLHRPNDDAIAGNAHWRRQEPDAHQYAWNAVGQRGYIADREQ